MVFYINEFGKDQEVIREAVHSQLVSTQKVYYLKHILFTKDAGFAPIIKLLRTFIRKKI